MVWRAAASYFAWVFGAGFVLGAIRVPLLVPRLGVRNAELLELPVMLAVIAWASRRTVRGSANGSARQQLAIGGLAWVMLLVAEVVLGMALTGRGPLAVVLAHDPVSGACYYAATILFALAPWLWQRRQASAIAVAATATTAATPTTTPVARPSRNTLVKAMPSGNGATSASSSGVRSSSPTGRPQ
jgi:hypothetical protein